MQCLTHGAAGTDSDAASRLITGGVIDAGFPVINLPPKASLWAGMIFRTADGHLYSASWRGYMRLTSHKDAAEHKPSAGQGQRPLVIYYRQFRSLWAAGHQPPK